MLNLSLDETVNEMATHTPTPFLCSAGDPKPEWFARGDTAALPLQPSSSATASHTRSALMRVCARLTQAAIALCTPILSVALSMPAAHAAANVQIVPVGLANATANYTSLRLKTGNVPVVAFYNLGAGELNLATCTANCASASPTYQVVVVDSASGVGQYASLALNNSGNPVISYYDVPSGNLLLATCTASCSSASPTWQKVIVDATGDVGRHTSIELDGSDRPVISYYDATNGNLKLATCTANCATASPTWQIVTVDNSVNDVGRFTSLRINASNRPLISYYDATAKKLKLATCTANCATASPTWQIVTAGDAAADVGKYTSLQITLLGNPVISYYADAPDYELKLATCTANCATASPTWQIVTVDSNGFVGDSNSLALTANGNPVIAYTESNLPQRLRLATCVANCASASPTWQVETLDTTDGQFPSMQLASTGNPLLSGLPIISYTSSTRSINVATVTAASTFTVTASPNPASGGGVLSCIPTGGGAGGATTTIGSGGTTTCTATPDSGFATASISGCGGTATGAGVNTYVSGVVVSDCTVTATFTATGSVNGACGAANNVASQNAPSTNLCSVGTASAVSTNASNYAWTCAGVNGGTTASCSAPRLFAVSGTAGMGGTINCTSPVLAGATTTCTAAPAVGFQTQSMSGCGGATTGVGVNTFTTGAVSANCTVTAAFVAAPVVNGACGTAHNTFSLTAPATNLCAAGTASAVTTLTSSYTWTCSGSGGGTNSSCQAIRQFSVTASAGPGGTLVCDPTRTSVLAAYCTATPTNGYQTQSISGCGGTPTGPGINDYFAQAGTSNCTVTAVFAPIAGQASNAQPIPTISVAGLAVLMLLLLGHGGLRARMRP